MMKDHASDFGLGLSDTQDCINIGSEIVQNSTRIFARVYDHHFKKDGMGNTQLQFVFFSKQGQAVVGDDM